MHHLIGGLNVSRETMDRLTHFEALTQKWTRTINLVSRDSQADIWSRHILDSAQLFDLGHNFKGKWLDIGSGGGFPGVVAAILLADQDADCTITLLESDQRKAAFLRTAIRECGVAGEILTGRIESAPQAHADTLTARALAPVADLLAHAERHLTENGIALFHKGRNYEEEVAAARENWHFDLVAHQSQTAVDARIIELRNIRRAIA